MQCSAREGMEVIDFQIQGFCLQAAALGKTCNKASV